MVQPPKNVIPSLVQFAPTAAKQGSNRSNYRFFQNCSKQPVNPINTAFYVYPDVVALNIVSHDQHDV